MSWLAFLIAFFFPFCLSMIVLLLAPLKERRRARSHEIDVIREILPGFDCGLCGREDCRDYAKGLVSESADPALCAPGGPSVEEGIRSRLSDARREPRIAFVACGGGNSKAESFFSYNGVDDCAAAVRLYKGPKTCVDSCIGLGSCARICPVSAITVSDGLAKIDGSLCTGCGACLRTCPTKVIALVPDTRHWHIACNSRKSGEEKGRVCEVSCTACGECTRLSFLGEFSVEHGLAFSSRTVPETGPGAGAFDVIARRCPTGAIHKTDSPKKMPSSS